MPKYRPVINQIYICNSVNAKVLSHKEFKHYPYVENEFDKTGDVFRYALDIAEGKAALILISKSQDFLKVAEFLAGVEKKVTSKMLAEVTATPRPMSFYYSGD